MRQILVLTFLGGSWTTVVSNVNWLREIEGLPDIRYLLFVAHDGGWNYKLELNNVMITSDTIMFKNPDFTNFGEDEASRFVIKNLYRVRSLQRLTLP